MLRCSARIVQANLRSPFDLHADLLAVQDAKNIASTA